MNKIIATLGLLAVMASPVLALDSNADAVTSNSAEFNVEVPAQDTLAALPGTGAQNMADMAIGAACASSLKLSLSDDQLEKMAKLKADFGDLSAQKRAELQTLQRQLRDSISSENVDKSKALDLQNKINKLRNDISTAQLSMRLDSLDVLNAEQKQKLRHAALERQVFGKKAHHRGGGHGFNKRGGHGPHKSGKLGPRPGQGPVGFENPGSDENNS